MNKNERPDMETEFKKVLTEEGERINNEKMATNTLFLLKYLLRTNQISPQDTYHDLMKYLADHESGYEKSDKIADSIIKSDEAPSGQSEEDKTIERELKHIASESKKMSEYISSADSVLRGNENIRIDTTVEKIIQTLSKEPEKTEE